MKALLFIFGILLSSANSFINIENVEFDTEFGKRHNNISVLYLDQEFNLTLSLSYNLSDVIANDTHLIALNIKLPTRSYNRNQNCATNQFALEPDVCESKLITESLVDISRIDLYQIRNSMHQNVNFTLMSNTSHLIIEINISNLSDESLNLKINFKTLKKYYSLVGEVIDFNLLAMIKSQVSNYSSSKNVTASLYVFGAKLNILSSFSRSDIEAGVLLTASFTVELDLQDSMEFANLTRIELLPPSNVAGIEKFSNLTLESNGKYIFLKDQLIENHNRYSCSIDLKIKINYPIGSDLKFSLSVSFYGATYKGHYSFQKQINLSTTKRLSNHRLIGTIPLTLAGNNNFTIGYSFNMPKGTLYQVKLHSIHGIHEVFSSSNVRPISVSMLLSQISTDSGVYLSNPSAANVKADDIIVESSQRLKRSTSNLNQVKNSPPETDIINDGTSGAGVSLTTVIGNNEKTPQTEGQIHAEVRIDMNQKSHSLSSSSLGQVEPYFTFKKIYTYIGNQDHSEFPNFSTELLANYSVSSPLTATNVVLKDDIPGLECKDFTSNRNIDVSTEASQPTFTSKDNLSNNELIRVTYSCSLTDEKKFPETKTILTAYLTYQINGTAYSATANQCIYRRSPNRIIQTPTNAFVILFILLGLILGFGLMFLILFLCIRLCRGGLGPLFAGNRSEDDEKFISKDNKRLIAATQSGDLNDVFNADESINVNDSVVKSLLLPDRVDVQRSLNNLDVLHCIVVDKDIETNQEVLSMDAFILLLAALRTNDTISVELYSAARTKFDKDVKELRERNTAEYTEALSKKVEEMKKVNKVKFQSLVTSQAQERKVTGEQVKNDDAPENALEILEKQHKIERDDLIQLMKLSQDEEMENVRKEFAIEKKLELRSIENNLLSDIISQGELDRNQADWLLNQHRLTVEKLDTLHNEEMARQRRRLDEKLEQRKALLTLKDLGDEGVSETLNCIAKQGNSAVKRFLNRSMILDSQAEDYLRQFKESAVTAKKSMDEEKLKQEEDLKKRLSQLKSKRLSAKRAENDASIGNKRKVFQDAVSEMENGGSALDPCQYIASVFKLRSKQNEEIHRLENDIDMADTEELLKTYKSVAQQTEVMLVDNKKDVFNQISQECDISEDELQKILQRHDKEVQNLIQEIEEEREIQKKKLQERLDQRRKKLEEEFLDDKKDQETLRKYEEGVMASLLENQITLSDEEREKIMKEHERNLLKLDESLTLVKLRQKQMLEKAFQERKKRNLEQLNLEHKFEEDRLLKRQGEIDSEDEEANEDQHQERLALMKKQTKQRLQVALGLSEVVAEDEDEIIREHMLKERANALKAQEERIATMLSEYQITKAKEMALIEEQQKAIEKLKMNLMDYLSETKVLSDDKCRFILNTHIKEQDKLLSKLDTQRLKQEERIRHQMEKRLMDKEKQMLSDNDRALQEELKKISPTEKGKAKIRTVVIKEKQQRKLDQMKKKLESECQQALEEDRRRLEISKQMMLQEQDMKFVTGLLKVGKFKSNELSAVLFHLFPLKNRDEINELLQKILPPETLEAASKEPPPEDDEGPNPLLERTKLLTSITSSIAARKLLKLSPTYRMRDRKGELASNNRLPSVDRPEPIGGPADDFDEDFDYERRAKKEMKKKKKRPKNVQPIMETFDDDDF